VQHAYRTVEAGGKKCAAHNVLTGGPLDYQMSWRGIAQQTPAQATRAQDTRGARHCTMFVALTSTGREDTVFACKHYRRVLRRVPFTC
jgi:hypothetical protein